jgi:hypothetical protein
VNQRVNGGRWNLLGAFPMNAAGTGYKVDLADSSASGKVVADAIYYVRDNAPVAYDVATACNEGRPGMLTRKILPVLLLISVLGNLGLAYRILDLGTTITYGADEAVRRNKQVSAMQKLFPALLEDRSRFGLADTAGRLALEVLDKGAEGTYVDGIQFIFVGDQVSGVDFN